MAGLGKKISCQQILQQGIFRLTKTDQNRYEYDIVVTIRND